MGLIGYARVSTFDQKADLQDDALPSHRRRSRWARRMDAAGDSTVVEIAKVLGVSRATIYRRLTPFR
jgi:DNA invertase Pin-like site-specific DNA recombinase